MKYEDLTGKIIEAAYKVHNILGFGFLENVYQNALMVELEKIGLLINFGKSVEVKRKVLGKS